ncbi:O-antigen ligase family protein [Singulisphaera sp. GP187]|uniref:O-antigen ligase family protein n=1 Tax=Singulisphaera sp. GP187 TaxID=1882752 RepID=UPI0020B1397B|nr:O-antigen ligase family protein [Singulisphaera sp. GP187]
MLATLLVGTTLAFGGAVWWAGPLISGLTFLFVLACLLQIALAGKMRLLKSPLTLLGLLALVLGIVQLAPLPAPLASRFSPRSQQVYSLGFFPDRVRELDASIPLPDPAMNRSPITVDRAATLHWIVGASVCLALFWGVSHYTDRLRRLYLIWGCLLGVFFLNTCFVVVQVVGRSSGLYGLFEPGFGPMWAPTNSDLMTSPNSLVLRSVAGSSSSHPSWGQLFPDRPFLVGTLMGGPDAYLALASFGLPLALAMLLQLIAPRGSRALLTVRLAESGQSGLVVLLSILLVTSALMVGLLAGPLLSLPFAFGLILVGLPSAWPTGVRWTGLGLTLLALTGLGSGIGTRLIVEKLPDTPAPISAVSLQAASRVWADSWTMTRDFPIFGTGLGSFTSIYPSYKTQDETRTNALSSLLQWWVESGFVGLALLLVGMIWCLYRLPGAVRRVGTADRALVFGLIGAAAGFSLYAVIHWTIELAAVAVAVSALGGVCNRWLAGGTDLFVERG